MEMLHEDKNLFMKKLNRDEIHGILLNILMEVDKFCKENGLRYSMAYGTLLGAVRHKGFIPWDDDIDILMPRPDFEKFVTSFGKDPDARYRCLYNTDNGTECFMHFFAKVHDSRTVSLQGDLVKYKFGLNIDVFPIDGKPDDVNVQRRMEKMLSSCSHRLNICGTKFSLFNLHQPLIPKIAAHLRGEQYWISKMEKAMRRYDFSTCRKAGSVSVRYNGLREIFDRSMFENYTELEFEGHMFAAFSGWDEFLSRQYGDYMQLPPENKRRTHNITAYLRP